MMPALVVMEQGAVVSVKADRFTVRKGPHELRSAVVQDTDRILLFGGIEITSALVRTALSRGIEVAFFRLDGGYRGRLKGPDARNVFARVNQVLRLQDEGLRLRLSRSIVRGKLHNQRILVLRARRATGDDRLSAAAASIKLAIERVGSANDLAALRGIEGAAGAAYFGAFDCFIRNPEFRFQGRTRRPPRDPVNAALSFGYALLASKIESMIHRVGLDPMLGAFHDLAYGRPSLVLDLMEEWRPVLVDSLVIALINRRQLAARDFEEVSPDLTETVLAGQDPPPPDPRGPGIHLTSTGRKILIPAFLTRLKQRVSVPDDRGVWPYEAVLEMHVRRFQKALENDDVEYKSYLLR